MSPSPDLDQDHRIMYDEVKRKLDLDEPPRNSLFDEL
jgi:hypothetical protein